MRLDAPTLFVFTLMVMAVIALLLLWAWFQNKRIKVLAWWGVAMLLESLGTALVFLRGLTPDWLSINLANAFLFFAYGLIWSGARLFNERPVHPSFAFGAGVWLLACQFDHFYASLPARASLFSILIGSYALLAAREFWLSKEPLASRPAIATWLTIHALIFFSHTPVLLLSPPASGSIQPLGEPWFVFIAFQGSLHNVVAAFLLLAMVKERIELRYKTASRTDPLTGVSNRRFFVTSAKRIMERAGRGKSGVALLLFDLDHFKKINDSCGHQFGDEVLKTFCRTASSHLRPTDLIGRLGGEEFAVLLPGVDPVGAHRVAERILAAFRTAGQNIDSSLDITASAGIAASGAGYSSFDDLFTRADRGLYKAKDAGRNRVEEGDRHFESKHPARAAEIRVACAQGCGRGGI